MGRNSRKSPRHEGGLVGRKCVHPCQEHRYKAWESLVGPWPNKALEPTAYSFGFAYASGGGSPRAFGIPRSGLKGGAA